MRVLRDLDYTVRGYAARVLWGHPEGAVRPLSHMVLAVDIGGTTYLADVGFGGVTLTAPLKLRADVEQATPHETFRLIAIDTAFRLEVQIEDKWQPIYQFEPVEQTEDDYAALSYTIAADYRGRDLLIAARTEKDRRYNLFMNRLTIHTIGGERQRHILSSLAEMRDVLSATFGIHLPAADLLDPVLERVLAAPAEIS
jgi:N-hydroxyarylamine O-acetyltransferase